MGLIEHGTPAGLLTEIGQEVLAEATFEERSEDAFMAATGGYRDSDFRLTAWDKGVQRLVGYTGTPASPVAFMSTETESGWTAANGEIGNASAFQIQLRTSGYENLTFTASQKSSLTGPTAFALAYSLDGTQWTAIADSHRTVERLAGDNYTDLVQTYNEFALPAAMASRDIVFLRVYLTGEGTDGNTSINDIEIWGTALISQEGFSAEMLGLVPGATTASIGLTWHDWTSVFNKESTSLVKFAPKSDMNGNVFPDNAIIIEAEREFAYIRRTAFKATIEVLNHGTEYVYAVSSNGESFSERYSYTTPAEGSFTFAAIGDTHLGDPSVSPEESDSGNGGMLDEKYSPGVSVMQGWQDTLDVITSNPDVGFILSTGDNIDRNLIGMDPEPNLGPHQIKWANFFSPHQLRNIPFATAMGNHEARSNASFRSHFNLPNERVITGNDMLLTASTGIQQENENRANYFYLYNNALFVSLNTAPRPRDAGKNEAQDEMVEAIIESFNEILTLAKETHNGEYDWLFVQTHKSVNGIGKHGSDFDIERYIRFGLESLMIKHEVDVYLSGHDHCYTRSFPAQINEGEDNFGTDVARADFRMNNVTYDYKNDGNIISQGDGTVFFTLNTATGQKFYNAFAPEYWNNENFPYLYDGTRGALHLSCDKNEYLTEGTETFGPKLPWNVNTYAQNNKPMYLEIEVTEFSVTINAVQFDHSINPANPTIEIVDTLSIRNKVFCEECDLPICICCEECKKLTCVCLPDFKPGRVLGNDDITIGDALEILMFLAGLPSIIVPDSSAWQAALLSPPAAENPARLPEIGDVLEILMHLAKIITID